jgi:hydrogenase-1 operon protein HyaE
MSHPLIQRLHDELGYPEIDLDNHTDFVAQAGVTVLFFAGDPARYRETADLAVVLPELVAAFRDQLRPGVVARSADVEKELQLHYGFREWPTLVFVREGGYLGAISRIKDWSEYLELVEAIISSEPRRPPGFKIPVVAG